MIYIGIDPSYSRTGVCYLDLEKKTITFNAISPEGTNDTYADALSRSGRIILDIVKHVDFSKDARVIMEEPMYTSMVASRLGMLSASVVWGLLYTCPNIEEMYTVSPNMVASINRMLANKNKDVDKKKISQLVVLKILEYLQTQGYKVIILNNKYKKDGTMKPRAITHDEAEAFIILLELIKEKRVFTPDIWIGILSINRGLAKQYQVNLLKGEAPKKEEIKNEECPSSNNG